MWKTAQSLAQFYKIHLHTYTVPTSSQNCMFSFDSATGIANPSILPSTAVARKQRGGASDRRPNQNTNSELAPHHRRVAASHGRRGCVQTSGSAAAAKRPGRPVTSPPPAVAAVAHLRPNSPSVPTSQPKPPNPPRTHTTTGKPKAPNPVVHLSSLSSATIPLHYKPS